MRATVDRQLAAAAADVVDALEQLALPRCELELEALMPTLTGNRRTVAQRAYWALTYLRQTANRLERYPLASVGSALIAGAWCEAAAAGFVERASRARGGRARGHRYAPRRAWLQRQATEIRRGAAPRVLSTLSVARLLKRRHPTQTASLSVEAIRKTISGR
jgi:hypothetical protein